MVAEELWWPDASCEDASGFCLGQFLCAGEMAQECAIGTNAHDDLTMISIIPGCLTNSSRNQACNDGGARRQCHPVPAGALVKTRVQIFDLKKDMISKCDSMVAMLELIS